MIISEQKENDERIEQPLFVNCLDRDIRYANTLLAQPLTFILEVVHGHKLGRQFNFPTINQYIPVDCVLPKHGVYASITYIGDRAYKSVSSIGNRPTFSGDERACSNI